MQLDERQRLLDSPELLDLLAHYADAAEADREAWHDRLAEFAGQSGRALAGLYGELIAYGWLEQNTGQTPGRGPAGAACYRATPAGRKAVQQVRAGLVEVEG
jgi:hypothetical protein